MPFNNQKIFNLFFTAMPKNVAAAAFIKSKGMKSKTHFANASCNDEPDTAINCTVPSA